MQFRYTPAGLESADARKVADQLQQRLDALTELGLTLKHVHWNVVGPGFLAVHEMLDEHVAKVRDMTDEVAERIATLGGIPNGLPGMIVSRRDRDDYDLGRAVVPAHLGALDKMFEEVTGAHRAAIDVIEPVDPVTADMLTAQTGGLELMQWFIRAHLENTSGELPTTDEATELDAAAAAATAGHLD
jgi:starvation-inducible DNA-binding protein